MDRLSFDLRSAASSALNIKALTTIRIIAAADAAEWGRPNRPALISGLMVAAARAQLSQLAALLLLVQLSDVAARRFVNIVYDPGKKIANPLVS